MSIEAMKLALEALELHGQQYPHMVKGYCLDAITALRQAIEQAQKQEPVAFYVYKPTLPRGNLGNVSDGDLPWVYDQDSSSGYSARMLVYTTPPVATNDTTQERVDETAKQRHWVGLTDEEIEEWTPEIHSVIRAIEAKLKEKNT